MPEHKSPQAVDKARNGKRRAARTTSAGRDRTRFAIKASLEEVSFSGESKDSGLFVIMLLVLVFGVWGGIVLLRADMAAMSDILRGFL